MFKLHAFGSYTILDTDFREKVGFFEKFTSFIWIYLPVIGFRCQVFGSSAITHTSILLLSPDFLYRYNPADNPAEPQGFLEPKSYILGNCYPVCFDHEFPYLEMPTVDFLLTWGPIQPGAWSLDDYKTRYKEFISGLYLHTASPVDDLSGKNWKDIADILSANISGSESKILFQEGDLQITLYVWPFNAFNALRSSDLNNTGQPLIISPIQKWKFCRQNR